MATDTITHQKRLEMQASPIWFMWMWEQPSGEEYFYLSFKLDNIRRLNNCVVLYHAGVMSQVAVIVHRVTEHSTCVVRNPSALDVVGPHLLPTNIQILQGFQDLCHYFTRMSPRLFVSTGWIINQTKHIFLKTFKCLNSEKHIKTWSPRAQFLSTGYWDLKPTPWSSISPGSLTCEAMLSAGCIREVPSWLIITFKDYFQKPFAKVKKGQWRHTIVSWNPALR